jgi:diguanylate cyclase (GGDEF)-like protein
LTQFSPAPRPEVVRPTQQHHTSGLTSRLIFAYVEDHGGRRAVEAMLRLCELEDREHELRAETQWFDFATKVRLFEAAAIVLRDPDVAYHIGAEAIHLHVGAGFKLALRAFGSPRLAYGYVPRAAAEFTWAHRFHLEALGGRDARFVYTDVSGVGYHRVDCQYNLGLLSCVPTLFDHLPARVEHPECALRGSDRCVYEVAWERPHVGVLRYGAAWGAASVATLGAAALVWPERLRAAGAVPAVGSMALARHILAARRQRARSMEAELRDQKEAAERLTASLRDLVSDLRLDEVLAKITANARSAVVGKEFALLSAEEGSLRRRGASSVPEESLRRLEAWASASSALQREPVQLDDLESVPDLAELPLHPETPLGSLYALPLVFHGERLGVLIAADHGPRAFLPREIEILEAYADQVALALGNARMVGRLETLARQDPLTGLLNHREFHETLERELERARRYGHRLCVVLLDLDGFKRVNDERGHVEGDRVLQIVAAEVERVSRASDGAFRVGGDEFALVLQESSAPDAVAVSERLRAAVGRRHAGLGVSYGVAEFPGHGRTKDELLRRADAALYGAKPGLSSRPLPSLAAVAPREPASGG